jgi:hypothetical protein
VGKDRVSQGRPLRFVKLAAQLLAVVAEKIELP